MTPYANAHSTESTKHRSTQLTLGLIAAALTLLLVAPGALAFQTRTPLDFFGPAGPGGCPGSTFATGTGDLSTATGIGDTSILASGTGSRTLLAYAVGHTKAGSTTITGIENISGTFSAGESIAGSTIPPGTTLVAKSADTLTLSKAATGPGFIEVLSGSKTISEVTTDTGTFSVGDSISGSGIRANTTITAKGAGTLTLSDGVTSAGSGTLTSGSRTISNVNATTGTFGVGWSISGSGIPDGATITAVGASTVTLSKGVTSGGTGIALDAGSLEITNVTTSCGTFAVGQTIEGAGIPDNINPTIITVGADTLTLSAPPSASGTGVQLRATSTFDSAKSLAFNQANDKLYVLDSSFLANTQKTLHAFNAPVDTPAGGAFPLFFDQAVAVSVDNTLGASANNLYLPLEYGGIIGLNATGAPLGGNFPLVPDISASGTRCDIAVDPTGRFWVSDASSLQSIFEYDSFGNSLGQLPIVKGYPCELDFDSNGDLYVSIPALNPSDVGIWRYTAASGYKTATQVVNAPTGDIAIDRSTHTLYAVRQSDWVAAYNLSGDQLYEFGIAGSGGARGVTVDESTDRVYVAEGDGVRVYGALAEFFDASGSPQAATNIAATKAELHATVDDNGALPTQWRFQVSKDGGLTWTNSCPYGFKEDLTEGGQSGLTVSCTAVNLQSNTDYLFRVVTNKGAGSTDAFSSELNFHTELIPPASATLDPAANITGESVDLSATIDDNGPLPTAWRFEVSSDGGTTWAKPTGDDVSGSTAGGESGVVVSGTAKELEPNTEYRFRIVTKKDPGAPDEPSSELTFNTLAVPPVVSDIGAVQITDTSATLAGEVNPRNLQTSYVFEYGPTPALGSSTPPVDVGAGHDLLVVSQPIAGLQPDAVYYFKLVATNAAGAGESPTMTLRTRAEPLPLPDDRAYEQVSPPDKNLGNVGGGGTANQPVNVGWDGQGVTFGMFSGFGDPPGQIGFESTKYISRRTPNSWRTHWLGEPQCTPSGLSTSYAEFSSNIDRVVIGHAERTSCPLPPLDPAAPDSGRNFNLYLGDYTADPPTYQLLPPGSGVQGGSEDFSHLILSNSGQLTPDAPAGNFAKLYDWNEGALSLISKNTANAPFTTASALGGQGGFVYDIAAGGSRIFFINNNELYMRQNGATTYDVSQSECTSACGASAPDSFQRANPAGNKVLITSTAKLTNEDTSSEKDLYLYTHSANPAVSANLTLLSKDNEPADGTGPGYLGLTGMSEDGDTVFFAAEGQLVAGAPSAAGAKLYRWRRDGGSPTLDYLATLAASESFGLSNSATPDGAYLLISSQARLNPGADHDKDLDVFRWDEANGWLCISCQLPGVSSEGGAEAAAGASEAEMTDDGQRIFFSAKDALLPADINGVIDVYEWHDGTISLISTGLGSEDSKFFGASRSGDDVFFTTFEPLVGWDIDDNADLYDARVGGGFPEPPPTGASCEGEGCRGAGTVAPAQVGAGSAAFEGPGNTVKTQQKCPKGKSRRNGRCTAKKHQSKKHKHKHKHKRAAKHNRRDAR